MLCMGTIFFTKALLHMFKMFNIIICTAIFYINDIPIVMVEFSGVRIVFDMFFKVDCQPMNNAAFTTFNF